MRVSLICGLLLAGVISVVIAVPQSGDPSCLVLDFQAVGDGSTIERTALWQFNGSSTSTRVAGVFENTTDATGGFFINADTIFIMEVQPTDNSGKRRVPVPRGGSASASSSPSSSYLSTSTATSGVTFFGSYYSVSTFQQLFYWQMTDVVDPSEFCVSDAAPDNEGNLFYLITSNNYPCYMIKVFNITTNTSYTVVDTIGDCDMTTPGEVPFMTLIRGGNTITYISAAPPVETTATAYTVGTYADNYRVAHTGVIENMPVEDLLALAVLDPETGAGTFAVSVWYPEVNISSVSVYTLNYFGDSFAQMTFPPMNFTENLYASTGHNDGVSWWIECYKTWGDLEMWVLRIDNMGDSYDVYGPYPPAMGVENVMNTVAHGKCWCDAN